MNGGHGRNGAALGGRTLSSLIRKCIFHSFFPPPSIPLFAGLHFPPPVCLFSPPCPFLLALLPSFLLQPFLPHLFLLFSPPRFLRLPLPSQHSLPNSVSPFLVSLSFAVLSSSHLAIHFSFLILPFVPCSLLFGSRSRSPG